MEFCPGWVGEARRGNADTSTVVVLRESGGPSIPEAAVLESKGRGVLRGYDGRVWRERFRVRFAPRNDGWRERNDGPDRPVSPPLTVC